MINSKQTGKHYNVLFPTLRKVVVKLNEVVIVELGDDHKRIAGVVDEICEDGEHFYLRLSPDPLSSRYKFSFKLDQIIKLN